MADENIVLPDIGDLARGARDWVTGLFIRRAELDVDQAKNQVRSAQVYQPFINAISGDATYTKGEWEQHRNYVYNLWTVTGVEELIRTGQFPYSANDTNLSQWWAQQACVDIQARMGHDNARVLSDTIQNMQIVFAPPKHASGIRGRLGFGVASKAIPSANAIVVSTALLDPDKKHPALELNVYRQMGKLLLQNPQLKGVYPHGLATLFAARVSGMEPKHACAHLGHERQTIVWQYVEKIVGRQFFNGSIINGDIAALSREFERVQKDITWKELLSNAKGIKKYFRPFKNRKELFQKLAKAVSVPHPNRAYAPVAPSTRPEFAPAAPAVAAAPVAAAPVAPVAPVQGESYTPPPARPDYSAAAREGAAQQARDINAAHRGGAGSAPAPVGNNAYVPLYDPTNVVPSEGKGSFYEVLAARDTDNMLQAMDAIGAAHGEDYQLQLFHALLGAEGPEVTHGIVGSFQQTYGEEMTNSILRGIAEGDPENKIMYRYRLQTSLDAAFGEGYGSKVLAPSYTVEDMTRHYVGQQTLPHSWEYGQADPAAPVSAHQTIPVYGDPYTGYEASGPYEEAVLPGGGQDMAWSQSAQIEYGEPVHDYSAYMRPGSAAPAETLTDGIPVEGNPFMKYGQPLVQPDAGAGETGTPRIAESVRASTEAAPQQQQRSGRRSARHQQPGQSTGR